MQMGLLAKELQRKRERGGERERERERARERESHMCDLTHSFMHAVWQFGSRAFSRRWC